MATFFLRCFSSHLLLLFADEDDDDDDEAEKKSKEDEEAEWITTQTQKLSAWDQIKWVREKERERKEELNRFRAKIVELITYKKRNEETCKQIKRVSLSVFEILSNDFLLEWYFYYSAKKKNTTEKPIKKRGVIVIMF